MNNLQGCVLAMCALLGAVSMMPLGCPSSHLQEMYGMAVRMIQEPLSSGDARCAERRLGCLVLSCLSCNLPLPMLEVRCGRVALLCCPVLYCVALLLCFYRIMIMHRWFCFVCTRADTHGMRTCIGAQPAVGRRQLSC